MLPTDPQERKKLPVCRGVLDYFPDAIAAVAHVSFVGNEQHNPGQPLHWNRSKSTDHSDCILRHLMERGGMDNDGVLHSAKLAWRALALLQTEIEDAADKAVIDERIDEPSTEDLIMADAWTDLGDPEKPTDYTDYTVNLAGPCQCQACSEARSYANPTFKGVSIPFVKSLGEKNPFINDLMKPVIEDYEANKPKPIEEIRGPIETFDGVVETPNVKVTNIETSTPRCYLIGPMTGYELFNFPAFDEGQEQLEDLGFDVISPATLDRDAGIDPTQIENIDEYIQSMTTDDLKKIIRRDVQAILSLDPDRGDRLAVLPGWERSTGSNAEVMLGRWLGLPIMDIYANLLVGVDVDYPDICTGLYEYLNGKAGMR
jgi:hypothetical protein